MAVLAEPSIEVADDRLAARNALVLAVAQALAGGNTHRHRGDRRYCRRRFSRPTRCSRRCRSASWSSACGSARLPVGMLAKAFGRRFALQAGSVLGVLSGVIACVAMLRGSFLLLLLGALCGGLYAAAHQSYRFAATDTASVDFRAKAVSWVLAGGMFGAGDRAAAGHSHQGCVAGLSVRRNVSGASGLRAPCRRRADVAETAEAGGGADLSPTAGRSSKSLATRASSSPSPAGWRATA